jgi:fimbrial chaperone protein
MVMDYSKNISHSGMLLLLFFLLCGWARAGGIAVNGTRVIYDANKNEASINIKNNAEKEPYLIQSWVDIGDNKTRGPFVVTPPLFRLNAQEEQTLRITNISDSFPQDRESLYFLNIRSIPNTEKESNNTLKLAVKTRIKIFYRPATLKGRAEDAQNQLVFKRNGNQLEITNPSAYHVVFNGVWIGGIEIKDAFGVSPMSKANFSIPDGAHSAEVTWRTINDYGGATKKEMRKL